MNRLLIFLCLLSCTWNVQAQSFPYDRLCQYMSGYFSSEAQSKQDSDYYDIRLRMIPIWPDRSDGYWLYVEQAMSTALEKPYRQRIYQVVALTDSTFESRVYEFDNPLQYANAWKDVRKLDSLREGRLQLREGCSIRLQYHSSEQVFSGKTDEKSCSSALRGASYATSEVRIDAGGLLSWDRGWDANGKQVWGAVKGGYHFVKQYE